MAEYIPNNKDDDFARPAAPDDHLPNPQPEPVAEPGPRRQSTQTTKLRDDYKLQERLGRGAYGYVKKAEHRQSGVHIAVKIIEMDPGEDFSKVQQEISLMEEVSHSNIVAYYGSYLSTENMRFSICMEYCAGGSLEDNCRAKGPLLELQIAYVCREALKGLQYLHSLGIIHRDIKGANILLTGHGNVKLADFGIAAKLTETVKTRRTVVGTWMAPEVIAASNVRNKGYNEKCDIWSLGVTSRELALCDPREMTTEEKKQCSKAFKEFMKACSYRRPDNRPTAEKLLEYTFVSQSLPEDIGIKLLSRNNIPN